MLHALATYILRVPNGVQMNSNYLDLVLLESIARAE
jgi:hypothetical protein